MANLLKITKATILSEIARVKALCTNKQKPIWLICESPLQAQENGFTLYKWVRKNHPEIDAYYVIHPASPAIHQFEHPLYENNVLYYGTFKQYVYLYLADRIISTHGLWMLPNELGILRKYNKTHLKAKGVMLNHGVSFFKNGKKFYHKSTFPLNDRIMSLSKKHKTIFTDHYGYDDQDVVITGYPRFDAMIDSSSNSIWKNMITFMPTFRDTEQRLNKERFQQTALYKQLDAICHDATFLDFLDRTDSHFIIYFHQDIQIYNKFIKHLASDRIKIVRQGEYSVTELLCMSRFLITDFSSVCFDFVYMKKPFISFQFDYANFVKAREGNGKAFLDIRHDLPGMVIDTRETLIQTIIKYESNDYRIEDKYLEQSKLFFDYQDQNNTQRVFDNILNM